MFKYLVTCKIGFNRILETNYPPNPTAKELYKYMIQNDRYKMLIEEIAEGQMIYDKIDTKNSILEKNLTLKFLLYLEKNGSYSDRRIKQFKKDILSPSQVTKDLNSSIRNFGDGCYGGDSNNYCHYPNMFRPQEILGEITINSLRVSKLLSKETKKNIKQHSVEQRLVKPQVSLLDSLIYPDSNKSGYKKFYNQGYNVNYNESYNEGYNENYNDGYDKIHHMSHHKGHHKSQHKSEKTNTKNIKNNPFNNDFFKQCFDDEVYDEHKKRCVPKQKNENPNSQLKCNNNQILECKCKSKHKHTKKPCKKGFKLDKAGRCVKTCRKGYKLNKRTNRCKKNQYNFEDKYSLLGRQFDSY